MLNWADLFIRCFRRMRMRMRACVRLPCGSCVGNRIHQDCDGMGRNPPVFLVADLRRRPGDPGQAPDPLCQHNRGLRFLPEDEGRLLPLPRRVQDGGRAQGRR